MWYAYIIFNVLMEIILFVDNSSFLTKFELARKKLHATTDFIIE